ncbi:MAG: hypothetical protein ACRC1W_10760 [Shewanella sp.]
MSSGNRQQFLTATTLDQDFLNEAQDNLTCQLELVVEIEAPDGSIIYASDRNKYVGSVFYEALVNFPTIRRTIGEWLVDEVEFSNLQLEVSNADGRFNKYMPGGSDYASWINQQVEVKLGLRDVASTYTTIFKGFITDVGGFTRGIKSFTINARDQYDKLNVTFPRKVFGSTAYPDIDGETAGATIPIIYGDWTVNLEPIAGQPEGMVASVPCFVLNANNAGMVAGTSTIEVKVSDNALSVLDVTRVFLKRNDFWYKLPVLDITSIAVDLNAFAIKQDLCGGTLMVPGDDGPIAYRWESGDEFFVRCKGTDLGSFDDNMVSIARHILTTYGGANPAEFDTSWDTLRSKSTPAQSAIANIKARAWIQEPQPVMKYVLSLLEQVRLEAFIDRNLKVKLTSLHFEDWQASPSFRITNFDVARETFRPKIDEKNNFNRAKGGFNFLPNRNENLNGTEIYRNSAAVTAASKEISKQIVFPNLYVAQDVIYQTQEILKLASAYLEHIEVTLTWRALLLDVGGVVKANVTIGAMQLSDVPCMIRSISYDPAGIKLPMTLWSMQMVPFPGYTPGFAGTTGGSTATIVIDS